jgi:hypothetical protein
MTAGTFAAVAVTLYAAHQVADHVLGQTDRKQPQGSRKDNMTETLTVLTLNPRHPDVMAETRDLCRMHSRIVDATVGMPDDGLRVLWATPTPAMLVIRAPEAVTAARLPAGYASAIQQRVWELPAKPGRYRVVGVLNPGRVTKQRADEHGRRKDGPVKLLTDPAEQAGWFHRRLAAGGPQNNSYADPDPVSTVVNFRATRTWVAVGRYREMNRKVVARCVAVAAVVDVHDPDRVRASVAGGVGRDKTWGCGLTIWEPVP